MLIVHKLARLLRIQFFELLPLGSQNHQFSLAQGIVSVRGVIQGWEYLLGVVHAFWVIDGYRRASQRQGTGDGKGGRIAHVIGIRLKRTAQHSHAVAKQGAIEGFLGQVHHTVAAAHIDSVHLTQEGQRLVGAKLASAGHEGADVLGQATAAKAEASAKELAADALVEPNGVGKSGNVRACNLADFGDSVDKGNLGGQERISGDLDQLGGLPIRHDEWGVLR